MVSGEKKLWINPILRSRPAAMLGRPLFSFDKIKLCESLSHALAGRCPEPIRLKTSFFPLSSIKRFVGVPEPAVFVGVAIGEVAENHEKISLCMAQ